MSSEKFVMGSGAMLQWALAAWAEAEPDTLLHPVDVGQDKDYRFDLGSLASLGDTGATAFVAWGPQFLNFRRLELLGELKSRGLKMPPLICRGAAVAASAKVGENCSIGAGAVIGPQCQIAFNACIGSAAVLEHGAKVGASAWIEAGVFVGAGAHIASHATLGRRVDIAAGVRVGKQCIVEVPGSYHQDITAGTHYLVAFSTPVFILNR